MWQANCTRLTLTAFESGIRLCTRNGEQLQIMSCQLTESTMTDNTTAFVSQASLGLHNTYRSQQQFIEFKTIQQQRVWPIKPGSTMTSMSNSLYGQQKQIANYGCPDTLPEADEMRLMRVGS